MPERPNILLVVFDTTRADAFEPYGARAGSSPVFADLARRGFAHPAAHANASWTVPSHAALFTGLLPADAGLLQAPGSRPEGCRPELERRKERLLQTVLGEAGYRTGAVSSNLWIGEQTGFDIGFESFAQVDTRRQGEMSEDSLRSKARWLKEGVRARVDDGAAEAGQALTEFLDAGESDGDGRPFYAFVNLVEAHSPYLPPLPYNDLSPIGRGRAAIEARRHLTMGEIWRACAGGFDVPEGALERMRSLYASAVRLLDDWLERVLLDLEGRGILDETIVIVTSDHGENFGEGGLMGHAYSLDQRLVRLPFAAAGPLPAPDGPFTLASVPSLLCEAVGVEVHPYARAAGESDGIVVSQFDPPARSEDPRVAKALEIWDLPLENADLIGARLRSAGDGERWKLLRRDGQELLHDLSADPLELTPVDAAEAPDEAPLDRLRAALDAAEAEERAEAPPHPEPADAVPPPSGDISDEERAKLEERMKLLGYL